MTFSRALLLAQQLVQSLIVLFHIQIVLFASASFGRYVRFLIVTHSFTLGNMDRNMLFCYQSSAKQKKFSPEGVHQGGNWWPLSLANIIKIKHALQLKDAVLKERYAYVKDTAVYFRKAPEIERSKSFFKTIW